jgi:hypothetical protein
MSNVERLYLSSQVTECSVAIKHILFDADGVLQYATRHWQPALQSVLNLEDEAQAIVTGALRVTPLIPCLAGAASSYQLNQC